MAKGEWVLREIDMRLVCSRAAGLYLAAIRRDPTFLDKLEEFEDLVKDLKRAAYLKLKPRVASVAPPRLLSAEQADKVEVHAPGFYGKLRG